MPDVKEIKDLISNLNKFLQAIETEQIGENALLTVTPELARLSTFITPLLPESGDITGKFINRINQENAAKSNALTTKKQ